MGKKPPDHRAVPLCSDHHRGGGTSYQPGSYHGMGWEFWKRYGIDVEAEICRLNMAYFFDPSV